MKWFIVIIISLISYLVFPSPVIAIEDPLSVPNNKTGIHILFPEELEEAAALVNSSGGEWGYVTIPIQSGDKDIEKWQTFMNKARELKVIPLIRLATEGDYFNTKVWRKPVENDVLDFANFLNSLEWPTKNRYVIVYNEVNRSDEWGGLANPSEYAFILNYAVDAFKAKNPDFFIIASGMDNAAATVLGSAYNQYSYFTLMEQTVPGIFKKIDGLSSHSYPNPAFAQPPSVQNRMSITSFWFESGLIDTYASGKKLPIFITETGWSKERVSENTAAEYLTTAFTQVWNNDRIVAITPFLLRAGGGPFTQFSFIRPDNSKGKEYEAIVKIPKVKGKPALPTIVLGTTANKPVTTVKQFTEKKSVPTNIELSPSVKSVLKWLLNL